jgi:hypothetical protein
VVFVVLALSMLIAVTSAQAAEWRIEGKAITGTESVTGAAHVASNLLVPDFSLQILCTKHTIEVGSILTNGTAVGKLALSSCKTWSKGIESPGCKPAEPIVAGGLATPVLHAGLTYIKLTPSAGTENFAVVKFSGETCALPEINFIRGSAIVECLSSKLATGGKYCEEESVSHLGQVAPPSLFPTNVLSFGLHQVTFDGIAEVALGGANKGKTVSAFG